MGQKIAQGVYDFRIMREDGYVYVDKTALAFRQVAHALHAEVYLPG